MRLLSIYMVIIFFLFSKIVQSQETQSFNRDKIIETIAESLMENQDENKDMSGILDELEEMISHPININTASHEDLERLRFLNSNQIENLLRYRKRTGQIFTLYEIRLIDGFNDALAEKIEPFIIIAPPEEKPRHFIHQEINLRTHYIFEKEAGFIANENGDKHFTDIEPKLYLKYTGEKDERLNWSLTAENDAGEPFFKGINKAGFDFYSGHIGWNGKKILRQIIIGDFQVKTGQGLIFWSGYGGRKTVDGMSLRFMGQGIHSYSSSTEYGFYRGVATEFETGKINIITFYSNRNADANVINYYEKGVPLSVSSIQETGYHRTENEIADKGSLNIQTAGLSAGFSDNNFRASINSGYQYFHIPMEPENQLYNQYYFRGKENYCLSADFQQVLHNVSIFGEAAISRSGGTALLAGIDASPASEIGFNLLYRDYKKNFHSIGGNAFSEFGTVMNERGIFSSINLFSIRKVTLSAYLDLYESYWVKYLSIRPVKGNDFAIQANWELVKQLNLQVRFTTETRNENSYKLTSIKTDTNKTINRIRLNAEWLPSDYLTLRLRSEWNGIYRADSLSQGWLVLMDATSRFFHERLTTTVRFAWYKTDNYNSGIRMYENDLPQSFNFPVYYLNGLRYYLNIGYRLSRKITFFLKISQTMLLSDSAIIGSGDMQINDNHKSELKFQMRFKF
jgi:hypothetical protein